MKYLSWAVLLIALCLIAPAPTTAQKPDIVVQSGHHQTVYALAVSPDKRLLASGGTDNAIIIWDIAQAKQLYSLRGHSQWVFSLSFHPNGRLLASGSADGTARVWDVFRGVKVEDISIQPRGVTCVTFSPDGSTLAISGNDSVIRIWDVVANKMTAELRGHKAAVDGIAYSRDGRSLISMSHDGTLRLWDLNTRKWETLTAFPTELSFAEDVDMALSPDGNVVAVTSKNNFALIFDLRTRERAVTSFPVDEETKQSEKIKGLVFASNEMLACLVNSKVRLWNFRTGKSTAIAESPINTDSAITISSDLSTLAYSHDENVGIYDIATKQTKRFRGSFDFLNSSINLAFLPDNRALYAVGRTLWKFGDDFEYFSLPGGLNIMADLGGPRYVYIPSINAVANFGTRSGDTASKPDITIMTGLGTNNSQKSVVKAHDKPIDAFTVSPTKNLLASCSSDGMIKIWDVNNWDKPKEVLQELAYDVAFSPDGDLLVSASSGGLKLWDTKTWKSRPVATTLKGAVSQGRFGQTRFSPDGSLIASVITDEGISQDLVLWSREGEQLFRFDLEPFPPDWRAGDMLSRVPFPSASLMMTLFNFTGLWQGWGPLSFSHDSNMIVSQYMNPATGKISLKIWDTRTGKEKHEMVGHSGAIRSTAFSLNDKILASSSIDNTIKLWSTSTGEELATIVPLDATQWVIYTPEGRFDTNTDIESDNILHWSVPGNALNTMPLDIFMRDYYEPKLFERILNCVETDTCKQEFRQTRSLSQLNTVRPEVKITAVSLPDVNREVNVTVEVSGASGNVEQSNGQQSFRTTGVYDVRLFRDKQLVGYAPYDGAEKVARRKTEIDGSQPELKFETELKVWRESTQVKLDTQKGPRVVSFKVQLPKGKDASSIKFTAYAFNEDRVKSQTAIYEWTTDQKSKLPKADLNVKRRAYILSVGVNDSNLSGYGLIYADYDAHQFQTVIPEKLRETGVYDVVPVPLVSGRASGASVRNATKQNIETVFKMLAGKTVSPEVRRRIPNFQQIEKASPDDLLLITFSSHGYSNKHGDFYLLPSDVTKKTTSQQIPDLHSMISGEELALWLRDIEADEVALIIDSCQAAAAVESLDFKPGPFGSRGFGQIAYDKQFKVLAATQADNRALQADDGEIKGGLLTYALITEGLIGGKADSGKRDGRITLNEWLNYGSTRVFGLYKAVTSGKAMTDGEGKGLIWKRVGNSKDMNDKELKLLQRALLFNFSRQNRDTVLSLTGVE